MKAKAIVIMSLALLIAPAAYAQEELSEAQADYLDLCADCHGENAEGNGPDSKNLNVIPPDLTHIAERAGGTFDEKAVYDWIIGLKMPNSHGSRDMPIWGDWLMDEEMEDSTSMEAAKAAEHEVERRVMGIVRYLKTLQAKD
jgi:mono/diheme cytochrome c family protein